MTWEIVTDIDTLIYVKQITSGDQQDGGGGSARGPLVTQKGKMGRWGGREVQEGEDVCRHVADSLCCTAKTDKTL